jgi:hypothetical protein
MEMLITSLFSTMTSNAGDDINAGNVENHRKRRYNSIGTRRITLKSFRSQLAVARCPSKPRASVDSAGLSKLIEDAATHIQTFPERIKIAVWDTGVDHCNSVTGAGLSASKNNHVDLTPDQPYSPHAELSNTTDVISHGFRSG